MSRNGTTQNVSGRREDGQRKNERKRLGEPGQNSSVNGVNQIRDVAVDSSGQNTFGPTSQQNCDPPDGKILERLELIEQRFLSYVHRDQTHLEARLEESKNAENILRQEVQALKQEFYNLASQNPTSDIEEPK